MRTNLIKSLFFIVLFVQIKLNVLAQLVIEPFNSGGAIKRPLLSSHRNNHNNTSMTGSSSTNSNKLISQLMDIFKFSRSDMRWFEAHFSLNSLELLYPKTVLNIRQLKRCVLGVNFRLNPSRSAAIKLEFDHQVRARFDDRSRTVVCSSYSNKPVNGMPTEKYLVFPLNYLLNPID